MDFQRCLVAVTLIVLSMLLLGGFYVDRFPIWLHWAQYISIITFTYDGALELGFMDLTLRLESTN